MSEVKPGVEHRHIVRSFQEELETLSALIAQTGGLAEAQVAAAIEAVVRRDAALAERTVAEDQRIDELDKRISAQAARLLALRQPMAIDLRETLSAIRISGDLERIGDLAKNIAKRARVLAQAQPLKPTQEGLARMGNLVLHQLKNVLDAYADRNVDLALEVRSRDEEVDDMYTSLFRELLTYMMEDPRIIGLGTHLMFVAKNLERIGDHATNIAETICYVVQGEMPATERPKTDITSYTTIESEFETGREEDR